MKDDCSFFTVGNLSSLVTESLLSSVFGSGAKNSFCQTLLEKIYVSSASLIASYGFGFAMGLSAVCDYGISLSYSLTILDRILILYQEDVIPCQLGVLKTKPLFLSPLKCGFLPFDFPSFISVL